MTALQRGALGAAFGSAALLAAAFAFQYLGGLSPCHLCILQRWPHAAAVAIGILMLVAPRPVLAALGGLMMLGGAGIAAYHVGVEQGWWLGPATCVAPDIAGQSPEQLLETILAAPVIRCDDIAWSLLGISMAGWNAIASLTLAVLWLRAYASSSASQ